MYTKQRQGWSRHLELIILDSIIFVLTFRLALAVQYQSLASGPIELLRIAPVFVVFSVFLLSVITKIHDSFLGRNGFIEMGICILESGLVALITVFFIFVTKIEVEDFREIIVHFVVTSIIALFFSHELWKSVARRIFAGERYNHHLLILTDRDNAYQAVDQIRKFVPANYTVAAMVLMDDDSYVGSTYLDVPVIADADTIIKKIQDKWVDDVFIYTKPEHSPSDKIMNSFSAMGITTHMRINMEYGRTAELTIERFAGCMVITENIHVANTFGLFMKRSMDIMGALVGLFFTAIITLIVGPMIYFTDPGPIFFAQVRIGMNGRRFKMYKFRSMYKDAEERKKALMAQNQIKGNMFKMDNDPRIIGSGPDGTKHGIGWFIRKTSIDEFPQFWNILKGDMSLVGTRPPTVDEWENYELHHRARMSFRPGLTGLWQVSGRSDIQDFEEVVRLDLDYINSWSIRKDIWIIIKTALMIFTGSGAK